MIGRKYYVYLKNLEERIKKYPKIEPIAIEIGMDERNTQLYHCKINKFEAAKQEQ